MVRALAWLVCLTVLAGGAAAQEGATGAAGAGQEPEPPGQGTTTSEPVSVVPAEAEPGQRTGAQYEDPLAAQARRALGSRSSVLEAIAKPFPQGLPIFGSSILIGERPGNQPTDTKDAVISPHYLLGPGDEVVVSVWGELSLSLKATVSPEGYIGMPGDSRLSVNGLRFDELRETVLFELRKSYASALTAEKLAAGAVFLQVTLSNLRGIQVFMTGQVANPGVYQFPTSSVLLMNALAEAGGLGSRGSLRHIEIRRGSATNYVDLYDLLLSGNIGLEAQYLRHQDVVYIPDRARAVSIEGSVRRPAIYELATGETLADLLSLAGGLSYDADETRLQIQRTERTRGVSLIDVDLATTNASTVRLVDGDWVRVEAIPKRRREWFVRIDGDGVRRPGTYPSAEIRTLADLVAKADGLYEDALRDRIELIRVNEDYSRSLQTLDLRTTPPEQFVLYPEDSFTVFARYSLEGGAKFVTLSGHVKSPGRYALARDMNLNDVLFKYGGFTDLDFRARTYKGRATLIRTDPATGRQAIYPIDLRGVLDGTSNLELRSEDEIRIYTEEQFRDSTAVSLQGEVRRPGTFTLYQDMTINDLLTEAGGLKPTAFASQVEVARLTPSADLLGAERRTNHVDLARQGDQYLLEDGDIVFVRRIPGMTGQNLVTVEGEVAFPGKYNLSSMNERISALVARAGGLTEAAFLEGARLTRNWEGETKPVALDMAAALSGGRNRDIILRPGDVVTIPGNNLVIEVKGAVELPHLVQYVPGRKAAYYVDLVGGYKDGADEQAAYIIRANKLVLQAHRRFWFDPSVPPGSTIVVPEAVGRKPSVLRRYGVYAASAVAGVAVGVLVQR
jgi:polysaccharide export outer membrane protein